MKTVFVSMLVASVYVPCAMAITCDAGQYLPDDDGECELCQVGYYCPGDDTQKICGGSETALYSDEVGAKKCKSCPVVSDEYPKPSRYWYWIAEVNTPPSYVHSTMNKCRAEWRRTMQHGTITFSCAHTATGYTAPDYSSPSKCLAQSSLRCDAGYWIDTSNPVITRFNGSTQFWAPSYDDMMNTEFCVPVGPGYYSAANTPGRTACPKNTYSRTATAASAADCEPLCAAGATKFHVGSLSFNMYPAETCESPAIRIGLSGGECCVHLAPGVADKAVNIKYEGQVYHTIN